MATQQHSGSPGAGAPPTKKKNKTYPRIIPPPPAIIASPRTPKGRTRRNSLKDSTSVHSSTTSQTMLTAMTDSTYSVSNSSPGSIHEERPKVVLQMQNMDLELPPHFRSSSSLIIIEDENGSSSEEEEESQGSRRTDSVYSRSSMMGDSTLERKDSVVSYPQRRPTLEEQDAESQRQLHVDPDLQYEDEHEIVFDQQQEESDQDDSNRSSDDEDDKLTPLLDPVTLRLQRMDDRPQSQKTGQSSSVGTASFSASYGSVSLGGDTSLSSADSFNNSPLPRRKRAIQITKPQPHKPDLQAQPEKKILKPNPNPNPIGWSRRPREEFRRSRDSEEDKDGSSEEDSQADEESSSAESSSSSAASSEYEIWEEKLKSEAGEKARSGFQKKRRSTSSVDSGDVSIATFSDGGGSYTTSSQSLSEDVPKKERSSSVSKPSSGTLHSSNMDTASWNLGQSDAMLSVTTDEDEVKKSKVVRQKTNLSIKTPRSYSSWTSSGSWSAPKDVSDHWASHSIHDWKKKHGDLNAWTSGDDSSISDEEEPGELVSPIARKKAPQPNKPRSAMDKNAPWYCGDDAEDHSVAMDSMNSDSSSILSNLRKKKSPVKASVKTAAVGASDTSLSFTDLVKPESMLLADLYQPPNKEKLASAAHPPEESMSFGALLNSEGASPKTTQTRAAPKNTMPEESMSLGALLNSETASPKKKKTKSASMKRSLPVDPVASSTKIDSNTSSEDDDKSIDLEACVRSSSDGPAGGRSMRDLANESSKIILEVGNKFLESTMARRVLCIALILFLLFDIVLVIVLVTRK